MPCTTILVGKNASYDGSTIVARNEDSGSDELVPKRFVVVTPEEQPRHYRCTISHLEFDLPDNPMRYTALPNAILDEGIWGAAGVNAANVSMSATETLTTNERVLGADPLVVLDPGVQAAPILAGAGTPVDDPWVQQDASNVEKPGGIGEEDMVTIVLPYIRSAREGCLRLGMLLERYGTYEMNGIAFSDEDEIWWIETVGGHHWIARRVPDDVYVTMPNQLGLDIFDFDDAFGAQKEFLCSPDLREFVADNHLALELEGQPFNPREAFGSHSDSDHVYNTPRAWSMQRYLNPHAGDWDSPAAPLGPESDDIPWCRTPERLLTIEDVKHVLSLHYQGTPYDPYGRLGTEDTRHVYRPIGINRTSQLSVVQIRPRGPIATRAIQRVAFASNVFNVIVPLFVDVDRAPDYLSNTTAHVTTDSFYWACRLVGALADAQYHGSLIHVERYQLDTVSTCRAIISAAEAEVREKRLGYEDAVPVLEAANDRIADVLRRKTDEVLANVLDVASKGMQNGFSRADM